MVLRVAMSGGRSYAALNPDPGKQRGRGQEMACSCYVAPSDHGDRFGQAISRGGFDSARWCSWSLKKTSAEFTGYPVNIFFLVEDYPKRKKNAHVETWIVTTDLTLDFLEGREAAHLRWHIENHEFKRLSHLAGTKTQYFKDQRQFSALLRLFCLALTVFDAFFYILQQTAGALKILMQGCKFTWKSAFSQLGWLEEDAFEYLVTAGR